MPAFRRSFRGLVYGLFGVLFVTAPAAQSGWIDAYREPADRLITESTSSSFAWNRLAELTDTFGHRLSGSRSLEDAIQWAAAEMKKDGL